VHVSKSIISMGCLVLTIKFNSTGSHYKKTAL
jgi:hypothetical protein